jgi:hypothetical protein
MRNTSMLAAAAFLLAAPATIPAWAADLPIEISAAQITARSGSRNIFAIEDIHQRMQSAINCLVGPAGEGFDAKAPNPCAPSGNGVIPDTPDAARKARYQEVVVKLKAGIAQQDRREAMQAALEAADMIVDISGQ